jgi:hypothetical protein
VIAQLQSMPWTFHFGPVAAGTHVWWRRRLGSVVLLLHFGLAGGMPPGLLAGLSATAELLLHSAARAALRGFA